MNETASVEQLPLSRLSTIDVGAISRRKHHIMGILEVDVTAARHRLRRMRRDGSAVSFTGWLVKSIAEAVAEMPEVHGMLCGRRRVVFSDVDVTLLVERLVQGSRVPLPVVLRGCERSTVSEIDASVHRAATQPVDGVRDYELGRRRSRTTMWLYYRLPQALRVFIMRRVLANPRRRKSMMGTVVVTSVAAGLRFPGWIVPRSMHNLVFGVGSLVRKPWVVNDQVVPRDVLHLTVLLDHDVVDGAPAARFVSRLVRKLESAAVLPEG
jgi:pyruvate/2-oxoglutarate dehydrogenase complex dihydrolipoamide acyltransferase (E2) component